MNAEPADMHILFVEVHFSDRINGFMMSGKSINVYRSFYCLRSCVATCANVEHSDEDTMRPRSVHISAVIEQILC